MRPPAWNPADLNAGDPSAPLREKNALARDSRGGTDGAPLRAQRGDHELVRLHRVGEMVFGFHPPRPRESAIAVCSCDLWLVAPSDAAAERSHARHQAERAQRSDS